MSQPTLLGHKPPDRRQHKWDARDLVWDQVRPLSGCHFGRDRRIGDRRVDLVCEVHRLMVDIDPTPDDPRQAERDRRLESNGYRVVRIWSHEVLTDLDMVVEAISRHAPA